MKPLLPPDGTCRQDATRTQCPLICKYNHFDDGELVINAWELKCLDCGWRDTVGFRSDEMDEEELASVDPTACPFCELKGCVPGANGCEKTD